MFGGELLGKGNHGRWGNLGGININRGNVGRGNVERKNVGLEDMRLMPLDWVSQCYFSLCLVFH